jgi:hypothetical protein
MGTEAGGRRTEKGICFKERCWKEIFAEGCQEDYGEADRRACCRRLNLPTDKPTGGRAVLVAQRRRVHHFQA